MKNIFVMTENVKRFTNATHESKKITGESVIIAVKGLAGMGKTCAAKGLSAKEGWVYCRAKTGWTELWMLQDLCFELMIELVPKRKKAAFELIVETLRRSPRLVLIDEADKLSQNLLEWIRDLSDVTFVPFVLIGEKLLIYKIQRERRIWSRTLRVVEFGPITTQDILFFTKQATDLALTANQAELFREASEGDFRLVVRDVRKLEEIVRTNKVDEVTDGLIKMAIKQNLRGA